MTNNEVPPKPQRDVIREVDWLAVAPWLLVLRAVGATIGWPLVIGVIGYAILGWPASLTWSIPQEGSANTILNNPFLLFPIVTPIERDFVLSPSYFLWSNIVRYLGWMFLGVVITQYAARSLLGLPSASVLDSLRKSVISSKRVFGAIALLAIPTTLLIVFLWAGLLLTTMIPWQPLVIAMTSIGSVLGGIPLVFCVVLLVFASPLLMAAAVIDDADAFDIVSRAASYLLQKPGSLTACILIAWGSLYVSNAVVTWIASAAAVLTTGSVFDPPALLMWVATGFFPAYFYCAGAAIYLVMRRQIDGQPLDEIAHNEGAA